MKNYRITVNGNVYDVEVEEVNGNESAPAAPAPAAAPKAAKKSAKKNTKKTSGGKGGANKVNAPMPGKILAIKASEGDSVKKGDVIMVLEAMKMENDIVAICDGTIASIDTKEGASVEAGDTLATIN